jgi:DNA-binding response OmpR family regulator
LQVRLEIDLGTVEQAATGAEAMQLAAVLAPSIAILDLGLPVADGKASSPHYANAGNLIIVISALEREAEKVGRLICAHF